MSNFNKYIFIFLIIVSGSITGCTSDAPTVDPRALTETAVVGTVGTDAPQIYAVFPGRLTSHTGSPGAMTGITPGNYGTDITIVFTRVMDNASFQGALTIEEGAVTLTNGGDYTVSTTDDQTYSIDLASGFSASTTYTITIDDTAYLSGDPANTLDFANLEALYAGALTAATYVEFQFITDAVTSTADITQPTVTLTNPANGAAGVPVDLSASANVIEIDFSEAVNPTTVTGLSIYLEDSLSNPVSGSVGISDGTNQVYYFMPDADLDYEETYTLTISPIGNQVQDYAGNNLNSSPTTVSFSTPAFSTITASLVSFSVDYDYTATPLQVAVNWTTDVNSVKHVEIQAAGTFTAADSTVHDNGAYHQTTHTETIAGLAYNQVYSFRVRVDSDPATLTGGPFDNTYTYNAVIRTIPDTTEGATGNYELAVSAGSASDISFAQVNQDLSYVVWNEDGSDILGQYLDTTGITPDVWDLWPNTGANTGVNVFSSGNAGTISTLLDGTDLIVTREDGGSIYAANIYNNAGTIGWYWGGSPGTGVTVYSGSASDVDMAVVYSGFVTEVTDGSHTAELEYLFDGTAPFGSVSNSDIVINETDYIPQVTVSSVIDNSLLELSGQIITAGNPNYRIGESTLPASGQIDGGVTLPTTFWDTIDVATGGIMYNIDDQTTNFGVCYITGKTPNTPLGYNTYTIDRAIVLNVSGDNYNIYSLIVNGIVDTNILYDNGIDFSTLGGGIAVNDLVINLANGESDKVSGIYGGSTEVLQLADAGKFVFDTDAENYQVLRLTDHTSFITSGRSTSTGASTVTQTGKDFIADGVAIGDSIYNIVSNRYARITNITGAGNDTLTLSEQIFTGATQCYIIFTYNGVAFSWAEAGEVRGKIISNVDGSRILPDGTTTSYFNITNSGSTARNSFIIDDGEGNAIVIYELDAGGGTWDIRTKKINGNGSLLWADPADNSTDAGIAVVTAQTPVGAGNLIKETMTDGNGGAWVLYETSGSVVGLAHINTAGTVANYTIASASSGDIASVNANQIVLVYERYSAGNPGVIYARKYNNTPSAVIGATQVSVGAVADTQIYPRVSGDGNGGALVSWLDSRYYPSIHYVLYAQHLSAAFGKNYAADKFVGVPYKDTQTDDPYLIEHGILRWDDDAALPDEGIYLWMDERGGAVDIYFQNVDN